MGTHFSPAAWKGREHEGRKWSMALVAQNLERDWGSGQ